MGIGLMINRFCILLLGAASAVALAADDPTPKAKATAADDVAALLKTLKVKDEKSSDVFYHALGSLNQRLRKGDGAEETAKALFDHLPDFEVGDAAAKRLAEMKDAKKSVAAAELLLQMAKSRKIVTELGRGGVIIGRLVVADGKLEPDLVLAQMPVLADGSFAGEVGDMAKTVAFRALAMNRSTSR